MQAIAERDALVKRALDIALETFKERARGSLLDFTLFTKRDYEINWHHAKLCAVLDRFARGEIKRLIVSMPPRHGKSELVSRRLPAMLLGLNPNAQIISASYGADLAARMNRDVQRIMDGEQYRALFPLSRLNGENVRSTSQGMALRNSDIFEIVGHQGVYRSAGVGGAITGMGAHYAIIDDPIKNQEEADSLVYRDKVWDWYTSTLYTRLEKGGSVLITMTRWHEDDLVGRLLALAKSDPAADQWEVFDFPALKESHQNPEDPRELGDPLWPGKYDSERLSKIKASAGSRVWNSLYQQRPSAMEGGIIKRHWIKYYLPEGFTLTPDAERLLAEGRLSFLPPRFDEELLSFDCAFEKNDSSDYVSGTAWARFQANIYLRPVEVHERLDIIGTMTSLIRMSNLYPKAYVMLVERKANGHAVIQMLEGKIPGIVAYEPKGSKESRFSAVAPMFEAGNVYLPHQSYASWVTDFVEELLAFPNATHDDRVDSTSQALARFQTTTVSFSENMVQSKVTSITGGLRNSGDTW